MMNFIEKQKITCRNYGWDALTEELDALFSSTSSQIVQMMLLIRI
jgi:hypothetical protein